MECIHHNTITSQCYITFSCESLAQTSPITQGSIGAENRGSTDAEPRHVSEINFVFIVLYTQMVAQNNCTV